MNPEPPPEFPPSIAAATEAAHRAYNDALTRLDRAIQALPKWPEASPVRDSEPLARLNGSWQIAPPAMPPTRGPLKSRIAGLVWRMVGPMLQQQVTFNAAVVEHLNGAQRSQADLQRAVADLSAVLQHAFADLQRFQSRLVQFAQQITPLVDTRIQEIEASITEVQTVAAVAQRASTAAQRELERLALPSAAHAATPAADAAAPGPTASPTGAPGRSSYRYLGFEDLFRGSEGEIRARVAGYTEYFRGATDVLDVGCGRGEFLDALRALNITATGLDANPAMVDVCRARGLAVVQADALEYLRGLPDASLGGLIAVQVIEHLAPDYLGEFLDTALHKLRPGAPVVLETINPACWVAFFESYIRDLTHVRPIHPETLRYLLLASGFHRVELVYRSPVADKLRAVHALPVHAGEDSAGGALSELVAAFNANVERLNARMFSYLDYAVIARRP